MIHNDILEQQDLFDIAGCRRQSKLIDWLGTNNIPFLRNASNQVIVHRKAIESGLGVHDAAATSQLDLSLGFEED